MPSRIVPTDEQREAVIAVYRTGLTIRETSDQVGVTYHVASEILRLAGETRPSATHSRIQAGLAVGRSARRAAPLSPSELARLRRAVGEPT